MSTELQPAAEQFPNPLTGEALSLDSPSEDLARFLEDFKTYYTEVRRAVNRELVSRLDRSVKWTHHLPGPITISAPSPLPTEEWDGADLRQALSALVDDGTITIDALDAAVEQQISYKVKVRGVRALQKLGGEAAEIIARLRREKPRGERWIKVERLIRP